MFSMIAGMAKNRTIGIDNKLPWHYAEDLKYFKAMTSGKKVILWRNTYFSIAEMLGKAGPLLPWRHSIILSREALDTPVSSKENTTAEVYNDLKKLIDAYKDTEEEIVVIGGAQIYNLFVPYTKKIYLTEIHAEYEWDTFFPVFESEFTEVSRDSREEFDFVVYERKNV